MNSEELQLEIKRIYSILQKEMKINKNLFSYSDHEISTLIHEHVKRKYKANRRTTTDKKFDALLQKLKSTSNPTKPFGQTWEGFREFRICRKIHETPNTCSLYIMPCDKDYLPPFFPCSYLTIQVSIAKRNTIRCYYIANKANPYYFRMIIERKPWGAVSNFLVNDTQVGDTLQVKTPGGPMKIARGKAYVLIATGFGIAPVLGMLETLSGSTTADIWVFHGVENSDEHPLREELKDYMRYANIHIITCYENPKACDVKGKDYDYASQINLALLHQVLLSFNETVFYVFAPPREQALLADLLEYVDHKCVFYECYGTASIKKKPPVQFTEKIMIKTTSVEQTKSKKKLSVNKTSDVKIQHDLQGFESWLSDDAGRPGPLEWFSIYFVPVLRLAHKTIGLHFILFIHFFDTSLKIIGSYINSIYYSWRMFWTVRRKQKRNNEPQTDYLIHDLFHARILLSKIFHFRGFYLEDFELSQTQLAQINSSFELKEVIDTRRHLEQMRQDLDILTYEQTLQTTKNSVTSFLLSYIPNPLEIICAWKDWFLIAFVLRYRREEIERMYIEFIVSYRQIIFSLGNEKTIDYSVHELKMKERLKKNSIRCSTLKECIEDNKKKIQRLIYALANCHYLLTPAKWPRRDLLREIALGQEDNCNSIYYLELEKYLFIEVKKALRKHKIKVHARTQQILDKHKSFLQPSVKVQVAYKPSYDATVHFAKSDKTVVWDGENSILELGEQHNIAMESGCRAGNCHACQVTIKEGEVVHTSDHDNLPKNQCLTCISVPKGNVTIDA